MTIRVYIPGTLALLTSYAEQGAVPAGPGHAVTAALRAEWSDGSEEEWEYSALMSAADDSAALLGDSDRPRRVVLAIDVPDVTVGEFTDVVVAETMPMRWVAAVHADVEDLTVPVEHAPDLAWFGTQEIADLLALG